MILRNISLFNVVGSIILFALCIGCNESPQDVVEQKEYFPLSLGSEWVYQIDSVHYNDFGLPEDSLRYYRKEVVESVIDLSSNPERFSIDVYYKTDSTPWYYHSSLIAYRDAYRAVRRVNNLDVMSLLFPYKNRVFWDANQLNNLPEKRYRYNQSLSHLAVLKDSFDHTIFVEQQFDSNIIEERVAWELFANGFGLVEKKSIQIEKQNDKRKGFYYYWKLISHK